MTERQEKKKATGLHQVFQTLVSGKVRYLVLLTLILSLIIPMASALPACTNNWVGGACIGPITYTTNTKLTSTVNTSGNINFNAGVQLNLSGYSIITAGIFNAIPGNLITSLQTTYNNLPASYAGSGGGGGSCGPSNPPTMGYNTLAAGGAAGTGGGNGGNGGKPSAPSLSGAGILSWFLAGIQTYISGAPGGTGGGHNGGNCNGGGNAGAFGSVGMYIQGQSVMVGNILAAGQNGGGSGSQGCSGAGGGGVILIAYNSVYSATTTANTVGGYGSGASCGSGVGGNGGNGATYTYQYATPPVSPASTAVLSIQTNPMVMNTNNIITSTTTNPADTANIVINNIQESTGTGTATFNAVSLTFGTYTVTACDATTNACSSPQTLQVGYYSFMSSSSNPTAYETSSQSFQFTISVTAMSNSVIGSLTMNNLNEGQSIFTPNGMTQSYTIAQQIPLIGSNNIPYTFNGVMVIYFPNGTIYNTGTFNTIIQTEYENYLPSASVLKPVNPSNVLLGSNLTYNTIINQVNQLNAASVAGYVQLGNKSVGELTVGQYTYWGNVISFVPSNYGLHMPTLGTPANILANSIVQLSFNGNSVYRNVTGINLQIYNESLINCGGSYTTQTVQWQFWNVSNINLWPTNVLAQGFFQPSLNAYTGNAQPALSVGFNSPATGNVYSTCIYPSWARFNTQSNLQYNASGTLQSTYLANNKAVSNSLSIQRLYLQAQPAPVDYDIYAFNQQTQSYVAAQIYVYSYYIGNNTSILLTQLQVPILSGAPVTLNAGSEYTFAAYSPNGQTYYTSQGPLTAAQCSSSPCSYIIYLNQMNITNPQSVFGDISTSCFNTTTGTNQITLSCTYSSKSGTSYNMQLYGYRNNIILGTPICLNQVTASSGTLSCIFNNVTSMEYLWQLKLNQSGAYQNMNFGTVGIAQSPYGSDALWFAILLIITFAFLFLSRSIVISVILFDIGWTATSFMNLINVTPYTVPFLWMLSAVLLYLLNKK